MLLSSILLLTVSGAAQALSGNKFACSTEKFASIWSGFPSSVWSSKCATLLPPVTITSFNTLTSSVTTVLVSTNTSLATITNHFTNTSSSTTTITLTDTATKIDTVTDTVTRTTITSATITTTNVATVTVGYHHEEKRHLQDHVPAKRTMAIDDEPDVIVTVTYTRTQAVCPCDSTQVFDTTSGWYGWIGTEDTSSWSQSSTSIKPTSKSTSFSFSGYQNTTTTSSTSSKSTTISLSSSVSTTTPFSAAPSDVTSLCSCIGYPLTITSNSTSTVTTTLTSISTSKTTDISTLNTTATVSTIITSEPTITTTTTTTTTTTSTETDTETITATTTVQATATETCPASKPTLCGASTCVNTQNDKLNCGTCGNKCANGYACIKGYCEHQRNACDFSGQIDFCYGKFNCVCYQTIEGPGFCADPLSDCGQDCSSSDECPGNNVCLTTATVGCHRTSLGSCSTDKDLSTCPNPANGFRLFAKENVAATKRDGHRYVPEDFDSNGHIRSGHAQ